MTTFALRFVGLLKLSQRVPAQSRGWKVFETLGVEPVFPERAQAINYAENRAGFRSGKIQIFDSSGNLERTIPLTDADQKL